MTAYMYSANFDLRCHRAPIAYSIDDGHSDSTLIVDSDPHVMADFRSQFIRDHFRTLFYLRNLKQNVRIPEFSFDGAYTLKTGARCTSRWPTKGSIIYYL